MTLKAGEPLQNSRYIVQAVLDQSDFGITYDARHALLDQAVFLQTFNDVVRQRGDFAQLKQQFFTKVRSLGRSDALRVLDCFEENALPYVVLQAAPGQTPRLSDWLTLLPEPSRLEPLSQSKLPEVQQSVAQEEDVPVQATPINAAVPIAPELMRNIVLPQINGASKNGATGNGTTERSPQIIQLQRRIPLPLLVTALVGLGLGAGAGFALRFQPTGITGRAPSLFGQEQAFPPQGDWPITETPDRFSVEPKIEEPLYRTNVPDYVPDNVPDNYSPAPQTLNSPNTDFNGLPSAAYPSPEIRSDRALENPPSSQPSDDFSSPLPQNQAIDSVPVQPNNFDAMPNIQPAAPASPAPGVSQEIDPGIASERSPKLFKPPVVSQ